MRDFEAYGYKIDLVDLKGLKELTGHFKQVESKYSEEYVRQRGGEDGELGVPQAAEISSFERELTHSFARLASRVSAVYKGPLEMLDAKIKAERELLESKRRVELEKVEALYDAEKHAAEDAFGLKEAHKELDWSEKHFQSVYERYKRQPITYIPHWLYVAFALMIFLGEIPLNAMVFQIFAESQVMTWVMAFVVGLSVPICAHFIGIKFREHPDGFSFSNALKGTLGLAIVVGALYWLSSIRTTYLGENREDLGLTEALVQSSFMFFWLNVAVLAAAIMISYLSHDAIAGYQESKVALQKARKHVERREAKRVERLKQAAVKRAAQKESIEEAFREAANRVNLMKGTYDQLLKEGQEHESRCIDQLMELVSAYRHENVRRRSDKSKPSSFDVEHVFELELQKMKEKLNNEDHGFQTAS